MPKNEYGVRKLLCSFLRKSLLPYAEAHDIKALANFVSRYLQYEPLGTANQFPTVLPSPSQANRSVIEFFSFMLQILAGPVMEMR